MGERRLLRDKQVLNGGRYVVGRFLGEGAYAEVYRVHHNVFGPQAMKVFRGMAASSQEITSILREAIMLSKFHHPNIVRVYDADTVETSEGRSSFFTMQFVAGGSLDRFWHSFKERFVPVDTTVQILSQVCRGLAVAHEEDPPIVHRDIKPENILIGIDRSGQRAQLSDFGLATRVHPMTRKASAWGTPAFKAPETFGDTHADSCAGDVWALGTIAYLLLTDQHPYSELLERSIVSRSAFDRPLIPPSKLRIDVDPDLEHVVLKALAVAPEDRYPDARALLDDLTTWAATARPVTTRSASGPTSKESIGPDSAIASLDSNRAEELMSRALVLARQFATLAEAADLAEEAFNLKPGLRDRYAARVRLWRNGVVG